VKRERVEEVARSFPKNACAFAALEIVCVFRVRYLRIVRAIAEKKFVL
jgi:hypothetical protein